MKKKASKAKRQRVNKGDPKAKNWPVIFWLTKADKEKLRAAAKKRNTSMTALFVPFLASLSKGGSKPKKKTARKPKPNGVGTLTVTSAAEGSEARM